jgi:hypothetical protein
MKIGSIVCAELAFKGIDMSGRRPLIKGYFAALRLIVGAIMSSAGFVTLAGFTCFYCLPETARLSDSNALASPRHDRKQLLLAQCDNALVWQRQTMRPGSADACRAYTLRQPGPGSVGWKVMGPMPQIAITAGSMPSRLTPS